MSSIYCPPCDERIVWGRRRRKGERCQSPTCPNYVKDLDDKYGRNYEVKKAFKGIAGGKF